MKVVINKEIGVFHYTVDQMRYMKELADIMEHNDSYDDELAHMITTEAERIGKCEEFYDFYPTNYNDVYKYRSHRWVVEACEAHPAESQQIVDIEGEFYNIIENDDGTEYIITPDINNFIKGFNN